MRLSYVAPVFFGLFTVIACGGSGDQSQVEGTAATGNNINTGTSGGLNLGNGGSGTGAGTGSGGAGDVFDPNSACATSAADGEPIPVDLYFMVDITGSMNCPVPDKGPCDTDPGPPRNGESRWTVVSAALKSFVADPKNAGLGVGMRFFPNRRNICDVASYATPTVEIGPLATTGARLSASIDLQTPGGQTPTVPSLTAAIAHAAEWAKAHPTHRVAVVYATDGYPKGCDGNNTIEGAAMVAKAGFAAKQSIPTYVLGVGPNLADLNTIAVSGGTTKAFLVDTSQNAAAQLTAALASIRTSSVLDCTYTIPAPPAGESLEPGKVNITYTDGKGAVTKVAQDPAGTACSKGSGWQYSADGTQIDLCGALCDKVKADQGGKLSVLFGCATEVGPVK